MSHENSALPHSNIHKLNRPLEKLSKHNPVRDKELDCSAGMMEDFPILVPFLTEDMLGFQTKEQDDKQDFEFLYYYEKYAVKKIGNDLKLEI